jgi:hypothetical protein
LHACKRLQCDWWRGSEAGVHVTVREAQQTLDERVLVFLAGNQVRPNMQHAA